MTNPLRILLVTRSYPAPGDLYRYPFVHRRVLAYREAGHEVAVFRPTDGASTTHEYEGVECRSGDSNELVALATVFRPDVAAAHGVAEAMWPALSALGDVPICGWLHGSEIPAFFRTKAQAIADGEARARALSQVDARKRFWLDLLERERPALKLVFPSNSAVQLMREDFGDLLRSAAVVANPIDTALFRYEPKNDETRFRVLSVRPFDSITYANDLSVAAIRHLSGRPDFGRMEFTIIGDGPLFDETLQPIGGLPNVVIRREFLTQAEIAEEHSRHGIFLVPTRLDTQGVSRDEAMSSGVVPVTNGIPPVLEFTDDDCAGLAAPNDPIGLADKLWEMVQSPELFHRRSVAAAERVRKQSANDIIIPRELALLAEASGG